MNKTNQSLQIHSCILTTQGLPPLRLFVNENTKFADIKKVIKMVWRVNPSSFRLFSSDGSEIQEKDLGSCKGSTLSVQMFQENVPKFTYDILKRIGQGGQGIVYMGKHKITKECVAIKQIILNSPDIQEIESAQRESLILKALDHKNIVQLHEAMYLPHSNEVFIIMEYLSGGSLLAQANSNLSEREAKTYSKQIVDALAYCHEMNIVHCDLKLENIMIKSPLIKQVKIIDFGVSKHCGQFFNTDNFVGTLSYTAPEVLSPSYKRIQKAQDVWAIGCIIYALLFGKLPFDGDSPQETYKNIKSCTFEIPKKSVSQDAVDLLRLVLNKNPKERVDIIGIQNHNWFKEPVKIHKITISIDQLKFGRSSSVSKMYSIKKQTEIENLRNKSSRKLNYRRRSVTKLDNIDSINKIK